MKLLLLLVLISVSCMSTKSVHTLPISDLAKKVISPHRHQAWAEWKQKYFPGEGDNTSCDTEEGMKQWEKNCQKIEKHNKKYEDGQSTFKEACNEYCCLSSSQMVHNETGAVLPKDEENRLHVIRISKDRFSEDLKNGLADIPVEIFSEATADEVNWVTAGMETPVKNQRSCGSCWAFATMGVIEAAFKIAGGEELDTSEQSLVDCDTNNNGCNGGWMSSAINYVKSAGVYLESDYGYTATRGSCKTSSLSAKSGYTVTGYGQISGGEDQLKAAVQKQSVTVAVNASQWGSYSSGIMTDPNWCSGGINHAVNVVGYGSEGGQDFWLVRNSWGTGWGESGYIRLARGSGGGNGICSVAYVGYWPKVEVSDSEKRDDESGPVSPDDEIPDEEEDPHCAGCDKKWWKSPDCVKCLINMKSLKHKWFKSDMSNLTHEQEQILADELWEMKNDFERSLEHEN